MMISTHDGEGNTIKIQKLSHVAMNQKYLLMVGNGFMDESWIHGLMRLNIFI